MGEGPGQQEGPHEEQDGVGDGEVHGEDVGERARHVEAGHLQGVEEAVAGRGLLHEGRRRVGGQHQDLERKGYLQMFCFVLFCFVVQMCLFCFVLLLFRS